MLKLTAEVQGRVTEEIAGLFMKDLEQETEQAWKACLNTVNLCTAGKDNESKVQEAICDYDYLNNQRTFENGMRLGAQLMLALIGGGKIA